MSQSIIRSITRELFRAFIAGKDKFSVFGKTFLIEKVRGKEYRVTTEDEQDIGLRFMAENGKLNYFMA